MPQAEAQGTAGVTVTGDGNFRAAGFTGLGTPSNPYVLSGLETTAARAHGIQISNTRAHAVIRDVAIIAGGSSFDGIRLVNATNITIERADLQFNRAGIVLQQAHGVKVVDSTVRTSQVGILLEGTHHANIASNRLAVNDQDVALRQGAAPGRPLLFSVGNVFRDNNLSIATGQFGFHFTGIPQYDNDIDASNVVNFVPVRWRTHVTGTPASPVHIEGDASYVRGVTNIGQIVCYRCSHVRIAAVNASSGAAAGLVLEQSNNVTISRATAEGNEGAGIHLLNSANITIEVSSAYANRIGIHGSNLTNSTIASVTLSANQQGVLLETGGRNTIRTSLVERNTDGIVLDKTERTMTHGNTVARNTGDGIRISSGQHNAARDEALAHNGGAGVLLTDTINASVTESTAANNSRGGIVIGRGTLLSRVASNTLMGNDEGGVRLMGAGPLNRIEGNNFSSQARHIRLATTEQNTIEQNTMSTGPGQTGLWFDDETSYNNNIATSNTVGGTPVQWHVAVVGSPSSPIVLRGVRADTPNMTNVAQIMVFKASYVQILGAAASEGVRGIYALRSSSITIADAALRDNEVGIEYRGTQTGEIRRVSAAGGRAGVLLTDTLNVSVSDLAAPGARVAVEFTDTRSRGSVVERIDASGTREASVKDPSIATREPRHLIADAGLDKLAGTGANVTFSDAIGVARFGSERIVRQTWDFGDGETVESATDEMLRPTHVYATPGNRTALYTIMTADGLTLSDTVKVRIVAPPPAPDDVAAQLDGGRVRINWTPPESEFNITGYRLYRGLEPDNMTLVANLTKNETVVNEAVDQPAQVHYSVTSIAFGGESERSEPYVLTITPPPPPEPPAQATPTPPTEEEKGAPLPPLALVALVVGLAALLRRR